MIIPFNKPFIIGRELEYIKEAIESGQISGDRKYTFRCQKLMEDKFKARKILMTPSCTSALDMSALLLDIKEGDEVIMPSFTFVSTANAFVLRGAKPVFVDIREDTLNIDEGLIEDKITDKTKAIVPMHYAGVGCEMDDIMRLANKYKVQVVEDAAQGVNAYYKDKALGTIGDLGCYSFHETKNYVCGEGGALILNNQRYIERAEIVREKGTDRSKFIRGEVDKYTWVDLGSSHLPSDIVSAFLLAQLESMDDILKKRRAVFEYYYDNLKQIEEKGLIRMPRVPKHCRTNYHLFYILLENMKNRDKLMSYLSNKGIQSVFHYLPLHDSKMGKRFGYKKGGLPLTEDFSGRLLRLPFYTGLTDEQLEYVVQKVKEFFS